MGLSMTNKTKIILIVEGKKTEPMVFSRLAEVFDLDCEIHCFATNIYDLYRRMKAYDFAADIRDVLKEKHQDQKGILSLDFAYTYLIFDCDLHHSKKGEKRNAKDIALDNLDVLQEMASYFTNETDPSIGKLYINYPMMESFRDADDFFDPSYESRCVSLPKIPQYKNEVANRKLCRLHPDHFEKWHFEGLILQNLQKWHKICHQTWEKPEYSKYLQDPSFLALLGKQKRSIEEEEILWVINTSLFLVLDYFGNKNGFYDSLSLSKEPFLSL